MNSSVARTQRTNWLAIICFVLALISFASSLYLIFIRFGVFFCIACSIGSIITGAIAFSQIRKSIGLQKGTGLTTAGIVLSILELLYFLVLIVINLIFWRYNIHVI